MGTAMNLKAILKISPHSLPFGFSQRLNLSYRGGFSLKIDSLQN
jgi:hypothetical protein